MTDHHHGSGGTCAPQVSKVETVVKVDYHLNDFIDKANISVDNEKEKGTGATIFKNWQDRLDKRKYVISDLDEEMVFNIPFTRRVKITGITIIGDLNETHPSCFMLFKNQEQMSFRDVILGVPDLELRLRQDDSAKIDYPLPNSFVNVHHLTVHIPSNFGGMITRVYYIGFRGEVEGDDVEVETKRCMRPLSAAYPQEIIRRILQFRITCWPNVLWQGVIKSLVLSSVELSIAFDDYMENVVVFYADQISNFNHNIENKQAQFWLSSFIRRVRIDKTSAWTFFLDKLASNRLLNEVVITDRSDTVLRLEAVQSMLALVRCIELHANMRNLRAISWAIPRFRKVCVQMDFLRTFFVPRSLRVITNSLMKVNATETLTLRVTGWKDLFPLMKSIQRNLVNTTTFGVFCLVSRPTIAHGKLNKLMDCMTSLRHGPRNIIIGITTKDSLAARYQRNSGRNRASVDVALRNMLEVIEGLPLVPDPVKLRFVFQLEMVNLENFDSEYLPRNFTPSPTESKWSYSLQVQDNMHFVFECVPYIE